MTVTTKTPEDYRSIVAGAATLVAAAGGELTHYDFTSRVRIDNTPTNRRALVGALDVARHRGVRSSLRACLRAFDPEAQPASKKPTTRVLVLWKQNGHRTWNVQGSALAEGSLAMLSTFCASDRGKTIVIEARDAEHARKLIAADSFGVRAVVDGGNLVGLGALGAMAVWSALSAFRNPASVRDGNAPALSRAAIAKLQGEVSR